MKISKLFHWLYGLVMLLPIFAIGVTCGYAIFNKNAKDSYSGNAEIQTTKQVEVLDDILSNRVYYTTSNTNKPARDIFNITYLEIVSDDINDSFNSSDYQYDYISVHNLTASNFEIYGQLEKATDINVNKTLLKTIRWVSGQGNKVVSKLVFEDYLLPDNTSAYFLTFMQQFHYNAVYYQQTLDNIFYYSVDKVTQSNLFNWAYDSFLVAPFSYIVSLFSMPSNSPVVMLMSYWLAISIIWLVFDLVMYVPLLVHRWLDKGAIE